MRSLRVLLGALSATIFLGACVTDDPVSPASPELQATRLSAGTAADLGKLIFFDQSLSLRQNQSCAACHAPEYGFTGPIAALNARGSVYFGSIPTRFGNRRPPTAAYATLAPELHFDAVDEVWVGGNFWDGRATGAKLGNPAADQAIGPFLNPVEQALPDAICVLWRIANGRYARLYQTVWGEDLRALAYPPKIELACRLERPIEYGPELAEAVARNYGRVGISIKEYEDSPEVNAFSSKYDAYLAGKTRLTHMEAWGLALYEGKAKCNACHPSDGRNALFTDFTYDNIGVPANPLNPAYATDPGFVDLGLGGFLASINEPGASDFNGAMKVPTLRNGSRAPGNASKSFMHNGVFKTLDQVVHFYNTRDVLRRCNPGEVRATAAGLRLMGFFPACWPAPEVAENVNTDELGDLGLTLLEEKALVAYLETLNDGWRR